MNSRFRSTTLLLTCLAMQQALAAEQNTEGVQESQADPQVEETLVIGAQRTGDYTIITEDAEKLVETAGAMGDPLGAIFALPGVSYSESQEPAVRGSSPADNVFVVDFMPASYIFHEFGVSVFSEFILHDFQMHSAGFGPEYSGATGAVFDVKLREPKNQDLQAVVDFSMLRSGIFVESGLTENSAFFVSARRSLLDLFVAGEDLSDDGIEITEVPKETDYQAKYTWNSSDNHRLSISANGAMDNIEAVLTEEADFVRSNPDFEGDARLEEKYNGASALWEYFGDSGTEWKLGYSLLNDQENLYWGADYSQEAENAQSTVKGMLSIPVGEQFRVRVGSQYTDHDWRYEVDSLLFVCTEFDPDCDLKRAGTLEEKITLNVVESSHYVDSSWMPTESLVFDLGVQYQHNDYTDEEFVHPRAAAHWKLAERTTFSVKAGSYNRFPDLETVLPQTGNPELKSPSADHYTVGVEQELGNGWSVNVEAYYKELQNLPRAVPAEEDTNELRYVNETEGEARGVDIMLNKNRTDKWWGWFALSFSESNRTNLATDDTKEYFLDTPVIANWVMNYQMREKFNIGWRWSVRSGKAYTPITGVQENPWFEDSVLPIYGEAFSNRLPFYNRLDIRMQWDTTTFGKESAIILDIINALNYSNISERSLDYDKVSAPGDKVETIDTQGIGIQPALTYRVYF
ncbi:Outer membrane receptor proteins, mostly Fe transport [Alteromonadaceae bacterium Bs31]|nr:Outer membrane receptor proteins, mostly Fe transport [Alteromonadaceae bacterium Bs31]